MIKDKTKKKTYIKFERYCRTRYKTELQNPDIIITNDFKLTSKNLSKILLKNLRKNMKKIIKNILNKISKSSITPKEFK